MQEFSKVYAPILAVILVFSGFWYIKAYFGFFAMNEVVPTLGVDYITQFSFSVVFELIGFSEPWLSVQFFALIAFLVCLAYILPNAQINWEPANRFFRTSGIPVAPFWLRLLLAAFVSFWWIFNAAHNIGKSHACLFLQGKSSIISSADAVSSEEQYSAFYQVFGFDPNANEANTKAPRLIEVWRDSNFVYVVKGSRSCAETRTVLKANKDQFPMIRFTLTPKNGEQDADQI
jgi:hypothetical protein